MLKDKTLTYISLFSSAGVGCYGFHQESFHCVATNELLPRRLDVQRYNNKCEYDTGYIDGDITKEETQTRIYGEIARWKKFGNDRIDVVIATPPCQGMSIINQKKNDNDYNRNSLVVQSINMIRTIKPRFFVFENVPRFMNTVCEAPDGTPKAISQVIMEELSEMYSYICRVINFRHYGSNSSRERTLVIGVYKSLSDIISPLDLFPAYREDKTIRQVIGGMRKLEWGEFDPQDFYHQFRTYDERMRPMVEHIQEGKSAFDNPPEFLPAHEVNGELVLNVKKSNSKYTRRLWDEVCPTIHTRNDLMASQNTIHPSEHRVYTIRELMRFMSIPEDFRWVNMDLDQLNALSDSEKRKILKKEEPNIRQSIGEAVPTQVFREIAHNIKCALTKVCLKDGDIRKLIEGQQLTAENIPTFINEHSDYSISTLTRIAELVNAQRTKDEAYFTDNCLLNWVYMHLPDINKDEIHIIEPSVGGGSFLPYIVKRYEDKKAIYIDVFDINPLMMEALKALVERYHFGVNVHISFFVEDTLLVSSIRKYDLCVGNPPFGNADTKDGSCYVYMMQSENVHTANLASFFLEYAIRNSNYVVMIEPTVILSSPEFSLTRNVMKRYGLDCILDFNVKGFKGVQIETICLFINTQKDSGYIDVCSIRDRTTIRQKKEYITDIKLPYWVIYRNKDFDSVLASMEFGLFTVYRDRSLSKRNTSFEKKAGDLRILKSRDISDDGTEIYDIPGYDSYISEEKAQKLKIYAYINNDAVYITPNMTYFPRVCKKPKGVIMDGSIAVLIPKYDFNLTPEDMLFYSTDEFRNFYCIARNKQRRSLNIDEDSVFWFGRKERKKND